LKEYWENIFDIYESSLSLIVLSQLIYSPESRLSIDGLVFPILGGDNKQLKM